MRVIDTETLLFVFSFDVWRHIVAEYPFLTSAELTALAKLNAKYGIWSYDTQLEDDEADEGKKTWASLSKFADRQFRRTAGPLRSIRTYTFLDTCLYRTKLYYYYSEGALRDSR